MASWIPVKDDSDFSLQNLPYGVFSTKDLTPHIGVAIGDQVIDLRILTQDHVFDEFDFDLTRLEDSTLNAYASVGRETHRKVRTKLQQLLDQNTQIGHVLRDNADRRARCLVPQAEISMHLPMRIGDYTDFFIGLPHADSCAGILKPGKSIIEICPSFWELPQAYGGRASAVVVSGTPLHRPKGQIPVDGKGTDGVCQKLDFEVEFACFIGKGNEHGQCIDVETAEEHIFGFVLMNDWSARDIQMWEASMMGPLNGKNFCTTVSPWVVPPEALEPYRTTYMKPGRQLAKYLMQQKTESAYDIPIQAYLEDKTGRNHVAECNTNNVTFSFAQMLGHHSRGGCPLRPGDLIATGTLSGWGARAPGCFLEASHGGKESYELLSTNASGASIKRTFLEDGDSVEFTAQLRGHGGNVGFGRCSGSVLPAI